MYVAFFSCSSVRAISKVKYILDILQLLSFLVNTEYLNGEHFGRFFIAASTTSLSYNCGFGFFPELLVDDDNDIFDIVLDGVVDDDSNLFFSITEDDDADLANSFLVVEDNS